MAFKTFNRVKLTLSAVPSGGGTGTLPLSSASGGFQTMASAGAVTGDVIPYVIEDGNNWEVGTGLYNSTGPTLTRGPTQSSSGGSAIACTGAAIVSATILAEDLNQGALRIPGGEWTPLDFAGSTTHCLPSRSPTLNLYLSSQTFVMSTGNRLEVETYIHELAGSGDGAGLYVLQGSSATTAVLMWAQDDGNWVLYDIGSSGSSYNSVASSGGASSSRTYSGQFKISIGVVYEGSNNSLVDASINGYNTGPCHLTTADMSGSLTIGLVTDAVGSCSGRARLLV